MHICALFYNLSLFRTLHVVLSVSAYLYYRWVNFWLGKTHTRAQQLLIIRKKQLFGKSMTLEDAFVFPALQ